MSTTHDGGGPGMSSGLFSEDAAIRENQNDSGPSTWSGGAEDGYGLSTSYAPSSSSERSLASEYFAPAAAEVTGATESASIWDDSSSTSTGASDWGDAYFPSSPPAEQNGRAESLGDAYFPPAVSSEQTGDTAHLTEMYFGDAAAQVTEPAVNTVADPRPEDSVDTPAVAGSLSADVLADAEGAFENAVSTVDPAVLPTTEMDAGPDEMLQSACMTSATNLSAEGRGLQELAENVDAVHEQGDVIKEVSHELYESPHGGEAVTEEVQVHAGPDPLAPLQATTEAPADFGVVGAIAAAAAAKKYFGRE